MNNISWETIGVQGSPVVSSAIASNSNWSRSYFLGDSDAAPSNNPTATFKTYDHDVSARDLRRHLFPARPILERGRGWRGHGLDRPRANGGAPMGVSSPRCLH